MGLFNNNEVEDAEIVSETKVVAEMPVQEPDAPTTTPSGMPLTLTDAQMQEMLKKSRNSSVSGAFVGNRFSDLLNSEMAKAPVDESTKYEPPVATMEPIDSVMNLTPGDTPVSSVDPTIKKKLITVKFTGASCYIPPGVVFIGTSNAKTSYKKWLDARFKAVMADLGTDRKANGSYAKKYMHAVQFIRTSIRLLQMEADYETVKYVYEGQPLPRDIGMFDAVKAMLQENKTLIMALAPYYEPKKAPAETDEKPVGGEVLAKLQDEAHSDLVTALKTAIETPAAAQ